MSNHTLYDGSCEIVAALNHISGRWKLPILWHLLDGPIRYNELRRRVRGITNTALTRTLRELTDSGLVARHQYDEVPPHVEYTLTPAGVGLAPALAELKSWAETCVPHLEHPMTDDATPGFVYTEPHQE